MYLLGVTSNIMSIAGHRDLDRRPRGRRDRRGRKRLQEAGAVAPRRPARGLPRGSPGARSRKSARRFSSRFWSSRSRSLPIFTLVDQGGRLFKPLAYTKNAGHGDRGDLARSRSIRRCGCSSRAWTRCRSARAFLARLWNAVAVGTYYAEERHPISRLLFAVYEPVCRAVLRWKKTTIARGARARGDDGAGLPPARPGVHAPARRGHAPLHADHPARASPVTEMERLLQTMDAMLKDTPEVVRVFGKAGRAETSTDPAPLSMVETHGAPEAALGVAAGDDAGEARGRASREAPVSRRHERFRDADHATGSTCSRPGSGLRSA